MPARLGWIARGAGLVAVLAVLGWLATVFAVVVVGGEDAARPADAIAVLGAAQYNGRPSPVLRGRLDHAADLYRAGLAPVVLLTGGVGEGDTVSESEVGRRYLVAHGLPDSAVRVLPDAATSESSIDDIAAWFGARRPRRVILVSDGFHLLRLRVLAGRRGLAPYTSPVPDSPIRAGSRRDAGYALLEGLKVPYVWLFYH